MPVDPAFTLTVKALKYADPTKVEPHPPVAMVQVATCQTCGHNYSRTPSDKVHFVEQRCIWKCGTIVPAGQFECEPCAQKQRENREQERQARLATAAGAPVEAPNEDDWVETIDRQEREREGHNPLYAEAKNYAQSYVGTFDFMMSMKQRVSGPRGVRGPLSDKQVEAILKCKKADLARANAQAPVVPVIRKQTGRDLNILPFGRTSAAVENESGALTFLVIDRPGQGNKWFGWVFVKQLVGPEERRLGAQRPGESYVGTFETLIDKIVADPEAAVAAFGRALGVCGICGKRLTNEDSREYGMGPICRARLLGGN